MYTATVICTTPTGAVRFSGPYLQFIAQISKLLSDESRRQALIAAKSAQEVKKIITSKA